MHPPHIPPNTVCFSYCVPYNYTHLQYRWSLYFLNSNPPIEYILFYFFPKSFSDYALRTAILSPQTHTGMLDTPKCAQSIMIMQYTCPHMYLLHTIHCPCLHRVQHPPVAKWPPKISEHLPLPLPNHTRYHNAVFTKTWLTYSATHMLMPPTVHLPSTSDHSLVQLATLDALHFSDANTPAFQLCYPNESGIIR